MLFRSFKECLCEGGSSTCTSILATSTTTTGSHYQIIQDNDLGSSSGSVSYFVYSVTSKWSSTEISCTSKYSDNIACSLSCSFSINIDCESNKNVTIIWDTSQQARAYNSSTFALIDCCWVSRTDLTTTATTSGSTITYTHATTISHPTTAISTISSKEDVSAATAAVSSIPSISNTTQQVKQDRQDGTRSTLFSGLHIGIIIGTAAAAIVITILIMCVIWRVKIKTKSHADINQTIRSKYNQADRQSNVRSQETNDGCKHDDNPKIVVSSQVLPDAPQDQGAEDYSWIDIATSSNNYNANRALSGELLLNHAHNTTLETTKDDSISVYSHLRENKVTLDNPYNCASAPSQDINQQPHKVTPISYSTTNQKYNSDHGNKKAEPKKSLPIRSYNYTEMNPHTKLKKGSKYYHQATGHDTDNGCQHSSSQILQDAKPNDGHILEPYENVIINLTSAPSISNVVDRTPEQLVNKRIPAPKAEKTYANMC